MRKIALATTILAATWALGWSSLAAQTPDLSKIQNIVVIYAENRSFDNLYGTFPGANGVANAVSTMQMDRDGTPLQELPPIWGGLTDKGVTPPITEAQTAHLPNRPFQISTQFGLPLTVRTRDLWHRFYQNQMQINEGRNDMFVAYADSGALPMGYYDGSSLPMWDVARRYTLADNFFMGTFGGSFLNHVYLACACVPYYPDADRSPAEPRISAVERDQVTLLIAPNSPPSALGGRPKFVSDGTLTPDFYAVNTMQPPYQPSDNKPAPGGDPAFADPSKPTTLPPQRAIHIGDLLSARGVSWAWYGGGWQAALDGNNTRPSPNLIPWHQSFNYFADLAPGTQARAQHLLDGGVNGTEFIKAVDRGELPQVAFYKPQGNLDEHAGYADVIDGDRHIADLVAHLERSPQWDHMVVIITYDENGGWWDHVPPPPADRWGPGTRIPTIIVSPFAKRGYIDHTQYDTGSILRLITNRFDLPSLSGLIERDAALVFLGGKPMGDLTDALELGAGTR
ncbi:MAG TPA: acid phosphatase [Acetobacteraceae bacterium]|nr:acid phosphatase [Acetobacteraceae bacterium]